MDIIRKCPFCGVSLSLNVPDEAYNKIMSGSLVQNAWPEATATEREIFISGLCPDCQEEVFDGSEE